MANCKVSALRRCGLIWLGAMIAALVTAGTPAHASQSSTDSTEVIILGVDHTAQLVNRRQRPAALRAFFTSVSPAAICIERSPERFARGDHYEFTYEIQEVIVPWARETGTALCPFDWLPNSEDTALAFGIEDLERPPFLRRPSGFQGFLSFRDPRSLTAGLFFADEEEERERHRAFYTSYPKEPRGDFARRLFLYRTFMQARRIAIAAHNYPGERLLVVVGMMHKDDIEQILASDPRVRVVQPSAITEEPDAADIARYREPKDLFAIATFNLLGVQSLGDNIDLPWVEEVVEALGRMAPGPETDLLAIKLEQRQGRITPNEALQAYLKIADAAGARRFTWDGVKDRDRIDSFFDPFGNLTIAQRARLEAARIHLARDQQVEAKAIRMKLHEALGSDLKRAQLDGYWSRYMIEAEDAPAKE